MLFLFAYLTFPFKQKMEKQMPFFNICYLQKKRINEILILLLFFLVFLAK